MVVIGVVANPNTLAKIDGVEWLPVNLYINGDTFTTLYGMLGRAIGMMDTQRRGLNWLWALFILGVMVISRGTLYELQWRGNFADTWYLYCGPMVFICAMSLLTLVKNTLNARPPRAGVYFPALAGNLRFSRTGDPRAMNARR